MPVRRSVPLRFVKVYFDAGLTTALPPPARASSATSRANASTAGRLAVEVSGVGAEWGIS
jgi:hypothetical protein